EDSAPPVVLDSERGWTIISSIDWDSINITPRMNGVERKWRLYTSYEHSRSSSPSTVQIRFRNASTIPTFTHPWSEGADVKADVYSNWYEGENSLLVQSGSTLIEARFISPPRTPITGKLYTIKLEAWDNRLDSEQAVESTGPVVQLAYARPLPTARFGKSPASPADENAENPELSAEAAMTFALGFVEACINGDLPAYYRSQSDPVRSLDDGKAMARYRLNPPRGIPGIVNLDDYKRRYNYKIYSSESYKELFPEWFDASRPWIPNENSYLFLGHQDRLSGNNPEGVDYLVFLVEADSNGKWSVAARPGD
ncbi:MAG: hypothetical protein KAH21_00795, partial [Spirochaetaceae bacterium]|nr:hypothetical protein [Spirochaetaceae bacterium]